MISPFDRLARWLNTPDIGGKFKRLNEMPWLPKPFLSNAEWCCADAIVTHKPLLDNYKMETVKVADLQHTQLAVNWDTVNEYVEKQNFNGEVCFKRQGVIYIYDGRHRALAADKAGRDTVQAYVIPLANVMPYTVSQFASVIGCTARDLLQYMSPDDRRVFDCEV